MTAEIVKNQYPPNYAAITAAFPAARRAGVIFAYGDKIFVPSGADLPHELKVHEAVHCIRQKEFGVEAWWDRYLTDATFRYHEELMAHRAEYLAMIRNGNPNRNMRRMALKHVAQKLASPLYGAQRAWKKCADDIMEGVA